MRDLVRWHGTAAMRACFCAAANVVAAVFTLQKSHQSPCFKCHCSPAMGRFRRPAPILRPNVTDVKCIQVLVNACSDKWRVSYSFNAMQE